MKLFIAIIATISITSVFAKENMDLKGFNQDLQQNIDETLYQNPQVYEKKPMRGPASVGGPEEITPVEGNNDKLDEFDPQAVGNEQI